MEYIKTCDPGCTSSLPAVNRETSEKPWGHYYSRLQGTLMGPQGQLLPCTGGYIFKVARGGSDYNNGPPYNSAELRRYAKKGGLISQAMHTRAPPGKWPGREDDDKHSEVDACLPGKGKDPKTEIPQWLLN